MAWGACPLPDYGQAENQGVFCWWGVIKGKVRFWKQGIKSDSGILHFSNMDSKCTEERKRFLNSLSDIPPPPFCAGDIVVRGNQVSGRSTRKKRAVGTECPTRVRVRKRIHIPETILGSERFGRGIRDAHKRQERKDALKMEARNGWGRRGRKKKARRM